MTAHLTLVVDNSEPSPPAARPEGQHAWVHRKWRPRRPFTIVPQHPAATPPPRPHARVHPYLRVRLRDDRGAVTAEYAVVILAAVAFAGLLVAIMRSAEVRQMLVDLVQNALGTAS